MSCSCFAERTCVSNIDMGTIAPVRHGRYNFFTENMHAIDVARTDRRPYTARDESGTVLGERRWVVFERFSREAECDYESLLRTIRRAGTPERVHLAELFLDREIQDEIDTRYAITETLKMDDPDYELKRQIAIQRFLGYDIQWGSSFLCHPLRYRQTVD